MPAQPRDTAATTLSGGLMPFASHYLDIDGAPAHYLDEGAGPVVVFVHGNPAWSFLYRHMIAGLRDRYRCIAPDHAGFGLSRVPAGFDFRPPSHAARLARLIEALDLADVVLVGHDWGGPIMLDVARALPGRVRGLVLGNTWAWDVRGTFHFEWFSALMGGALMRALTPALMPFVNVILPTTFRRRRLTKAEMAAYRAPFKAGGQPRTGLHVFPRQITRAGDWLAGLEAFARGYRGPALLLWPENDVAFRPAELARWQELLPQAETRRIARCGHFLWEDAPDEALAGLAGWLDALPPAGSTRT